MPETVGGYLLIPCGGTTVSGLIMRKAVWRALMERPDFKVFDLAPFLAGLMIHAELLDAIPSRRRIAVSGCSECCPFIAMKSRGFEVDHKLSVNEALPEEEAIKDLVQRIYRVAEGQS